MSDPKKSEGSGVDLERLSLIPKDAKKLDSPILAEGEVTGHSHRVLGEGVEVFEHEGTRYLNAPSGGKIVHEEHEEVVVPPGEYRVGIVRETDHFAEEVRNVAD